MNPPPRAARGVRALRRLLSERTFDLRDIGSADFQTWLDRHLVRWRRSPVFVQRTVIRDLRRDHPDIRRLERERRRLAAADAASADYARLERLRQEVTGAERAIAGLTQAIEQAEPDKRGDLRRKLDGFRSTHKAFTAELAALVRSSEERQALLRIDEELQRLRASIGLDLEETKLERLLRERGRHGGRAGGSFERTAEAIVRDAVLPELLRHRRSEGASSVRVLRGVTLGAAKVEFDLLVVRRPLHDDKSVTVLAAVEAKRNINDLAHGFRRRQEDLAWLTGDETDIDPARHRTKRFPTGRFDRPAVHEQTGEAFRFTRDSFRLFRRDPASGLFLNRLYLVTRAGPVWGVSSAALSRIEHRVATDERWNPNDAADLRRLFRWCRSLAKPLETPDLLRFYAEGLRRARRILVIPP